MKKVLLTATVLCFVSIFMFGCPTTDTTDVSSSSPKSLSLNQADTETMVKESMKELGYNVKVMVQDFDENGSEDIGIEYISGNDSQQLVVFLAHITGTVGSMEQYFTWSSDKVIVLLGENLYVANVSDCRRCSDMVGQEASSEEVTQCLLDTWWVIEGGEPSQDRKKQLDKDQIL